MSYYIAGDRGLVGRHYRKFKKDARGGNTSNTDYSHYVSTYTHLLAGPKPTHLVINAATVGGLQEDLDDSFNLLMRNLKIQNNLFDVAAEAGIQRVLLQGSTCSYPETGPQPFMELQLLSGKPFEGYMTTALPKLVGMYQCRASNDKNNTKWRTAICTNMFGPGDRTGEHAHVVGALMQKFVDAVKKDYTEVEIWGDGSQSRDILYIKDAVRAMDLTLNNDMFDTVNIASGVEITIKELAEHLKTISGFNGRLYYNTDKPTGIMKRSINIERLKSLGWKAEYTMKEALEQTYRWYYDNT